MELKQFALEHFGMSENEFVEVFVNQTLDDVRVELGGKPAPKPQPPKPAPQRQPKKKLSETGYRSEITFGNDLNQEQKKFATDTPKKSETNKTYKRVLVDYVEESENGSQTIRLKKPPLLLKYNGKHNFVGTKTIAIEFSFFINANPDKENEITDNSILF